MNHSLLSADRNTHLKIVSVALIAAILIVAGAISARLTDNAAEVSRIEMSGPVLKAGKPTTYTRIDLPAVR